MIKDWILNTFYKKELSEIHSNYKNKVTAISCDANKKTKLIDIVHSILKERNHVIVGEATNKKNEDVFVVQWLFGNDIWYMLYSERYEACNKHPRIMARYVPKYEGDSYIRIDDILVVDNEVGNGSILMSYFIDYCKTTDAKYISGCISSVDSNHFDRLEHFYQKHGFDVEFNQDHSSGSICYHL